MTTAALHKQNVKDLNKSQKLLLYINAALGGSDDKAKFAKLQYFCDFISKAFYDTSISGDDYRYQRNKLGPLAYKYNDDLTELISKGFLEKQGQYHHKPNVDIDLLKDEFNQNEKKVIDFVIEKYGKLSWKELVNISHEQVPYMSAINMCEIPLFTAYNLVDDYPDFKK